MEPGTAEAQVDDGDTRREAEAVLREQIRTWKRRAGHALAARDFAVDALADYAIEGAQMREEFERLQTFRGFAAFQLGRLREWLWEFVT